MPVSHHSVELMLSLRQLGHTLVHKAGSHLMGALNPNTPRIGTKEVKMFSKNGGGSSPCLRCGKAYVKVCGRCTGTDDKSVMSMFNIQRLCE